MGPKTRTISKKGVFFFDWLPAWIQDALQILGFCIVGAFIMIQVSLCFNKRYLSLDSWSSGQKTILRIFQVKNKTFWSTCSWIQEDEEHFWLRINHSPPRGTMILNRLILEGSPCKRQHLWVCVPYITCYNNLDANANDFEQVNLIIQSLVDLPPKFVIIFGEKNEFPCKIICRGTTWSGGLGEYRYEVFF